MSQTLTAEKRHGAASFSSNGALALAPKRYASPSAGVPVRSTDVPAQKQRTPLSVVPAAPTRRRVPFAVFSLMVLGAALAAVLMLNISVSGTQYELVKLRNQQTALSQQNEALVLEIEARETPQNLAAAATKLGMVSSPTFGTIELDSKKVTGTPEPAKEGPKPEVLIAAPNLATEQSAAAGASVDVLPPSASDETPVDGDAGSAASGTLPGPEQGGSDR
ncbi:hypothetical protein FJV46_11690 [Arthrobacter agilis]|uniref:hypothetical protein n=1 Tax=Arthrobacter agilis TaxID=37921 RepID=UPI000B35E1A0|nr:hypothetical protein [Arthrobacter agilis]OUM45386.1 hypothetical protein B8W74_00945 [Arthrobacter agilis]PPB46985.1 hypothetical protein CI784_04710 [Arthrobacter agilis]TPV23419.1 hypothetical protein FJV46_11690 [Arthrobacter agilis]VDR31800.1 Uncharacterised protein [Arthrobacter agilis]